ncbi:MAG: hypothetical protein ACRD8W_01935 [Nitrososphaeraceae archaeon]
MKFRKQNDITVNGVRQGYDPRDAYQLRKWHNPFSNPPVQIWSYEDLEPEPEERAYWCTICKSRLVYLTASDTIWRCDNCMEFFDTKIQDVPVKNTNEFKVTPWFELQHYPTIDSDDTEIPFIEGIDHNTMLEEDLESRAHEDKRVQHINLHNVTFADAIRAGALSAKRKGRPDNNAYEEGL